MHEGVKAKVNRPTGFRIIFKAIFATFVFLIVKDFCESKFAGCFTNTS